MGMSLYASSSLIIGLSTIGSANIWNPIGWIIAAVIAITVTVAISISLYKQYQKTIINADERVKIIVTNDSKTRYWTATIKSVYVDIGMGLTYSQAIQYVISGRSIFAITRAEAEAVVLASGGTPQSIINEVYKG